MGGLREHTLSLQQKAELPSSTAPRAPRLIDNHSVQQPESSDFFDERRVERADPRTEFLSKVFSALRQTFVEEDVESGGGEGTSQWITVICLGVRKRRWRYVSKGALPSVCASVFSRFDAQHDLLVRQHGGHGIHWKWDV